MPNIISPISNQIIEPTQATRSHLIILPLADNTGGDSELDVGVLIGVIITGCFLRGKLFVGK